MKKSGFTLVELSIALVIIGLLIGGILVGQSLVESAQVSKIGQKAQQLHIAISLFRENTTYYPGDAPTSWFRTKCSNTGHNGAPHWVGGCGNIGTGQNGDIDGYAETELALAHLSWMGYLDKEYIKYELGNGCRPLDPGVDSVDVGFDSGMIIHGTPALGHYNLYHEDYTKRVYSLRALRKMDDCSSDTKAFNPTQALAIDAKFDDGMPFSGDIGPGHVNGGWNGNGCLTTLRNFTINNKYDISDGDERTCYLYFSQPLDMQD